MHGGLRWVPRGPSSDPVGGDRALATHGVRRRNPWHPTDRDHEHPRFRCYSLEQHAGFPRCLARFSCVTPSPCDPVQAARFVTVSRILCSRAWSRSPCQSSDEAVEDDDHRAFRQRQQQADRDGRRSSPGASAPPRCPAAGASAPGSAERGRGTSPAARGPCVNFGFDGFSEPAATWIGA